MKNSISIIVIYLLTIELLGAQIRGRVVDAIKGTPIVGVNIQGKDFKTTVSGQNGGFEIPKVGANVVLSFRYLGYRDTSIIVADKSMELIVQLAPAGTEIEEVLVRTGYQQLDKNSTTGSFSVVSKKQIEQQVGLGLTAMLPAIAPGVMFDNNSNSTGRLMVRGLSTIRGEKQPLIVIDNFPYEGRLDDINPLDVESVTVLKDAAASAIWGVRAGNGVIVVTTKKGKYNQKAQFRFSSSVKIGERPDLMRVPVMSSADFIAMEEFLFDKGYYNSRVSNPAMLPLTPIVEALDALRNGTIDTVTYRVVKERLAHVDVRKDYLKYLYKPSLLQQYHLEGQGGGERYAWASSLGVDRDQSTTNNDYQRLGYRLSSQWKLSKSLTLSTDVNFTFIKNTAGNSGYGDIKLGMYELYPYAEFVDTNGRSLPIAQRNKSYIDQLNNEGLLLDWDFVPLEDHSYVDNKRKQFIVNWNTGFNYKMFDWLALDVKYNLVADRSEQNNHRSERSYYARNLINSFSVIDKATNTVKYNVPKGGIVDQSFANQWAHNARLQVNLDKRIGDHSWSGLLGFEGRSMRNEGYSDRLYGFNADNLTIANVNYLETFPDVVTGARSYIPNAQSLMRTNIRYISVFANGTYTYDQKLNVTGSVRRDATNLFGLRTNDKWNLLWSLGASYKIIDNKMGWVDRLRLRTTYGFSGNVDPSMASVNTIRHIGFSSQTNSSIANFASYANPDLKWESIGTLNFGAELGLWNGRVEVVFDWYRKYGRDLYGMDEVDPTAGIGASVVRNVAKMKGRGADLQLNVHAVQSKDWTLSFQTNISASADKVESYYLTNLFGNRFMFEGAISGLEGRPVYAVYAFPWKSLDTDGNPIGYFEGKESKDYASIYNNTLLEDMHYGGPLLPRWFGSAGSSIRYKELSLDFRILYKVGHSIRRQSVDYPALFGQNVMHADYAKRWMKAGDEHNTQIPVMLYPLDANRDSYYKYSSVLVDSGSHIRFQYVHLNYDFKQSLRGTIKPSVFVHVDNLGLIWSANKQGIDPDYENSLNSFRPPTQWIFGVRMAF